MPVNGFLVNNTVQKYNYESLENYNTPDFSTSLTYQVGDYVMYQGKLYKCTTTITTGGAWDSSKWSLAILSDDVADLKSDVDNVFDNDGVTAISPSHAEDGWYAYYSSTGKVAGGGQYNGSFAILTIADMPDVVQIGYGKDTTYPSSEQVIMGMEGTTLPSTGLFYYRRATINAGTDQTFGPRGFDLSTINDGYFSIEKSKLVTALPSIQAIVINFPEGTYLLNSVGQKPTKYVKFLHIANTVPALVVASDGSGDYTTISDAVAAAQDEDTIYIKDGTYTETVIVNKYLHLVGQSKQGTILQQNVGDYNNCTLSITQGSVCNMTIKSLAPADTSGLTDYAYAIHLDKNFASLAKYQKCEIYNCVIYSEVNDAIGAGTNYASEYNIHDCFIHVAHAPVKSGACGFKCHNGQNQTTGKVTLRNNVIITEDANGESIYDILFHNGGISNTQPIEILMVGNVLKYYNNGITNIFVPSAYNYGNSVEEMNTLSYLSDDVADLKSAFDKISGTTKNLYDPSTISNGYYEANGTFRENQYYLCTDYIPIANNQYISLSFDTSSIAANPQIVVFDSDKQFIERGTNRASGSTYRKQNGDGFVRFSCGLNVQKLQIEYGVASSYIPHTTAVDYVARSGDKLWYSDKVNPPFWTLHVDCARKFITVANIKKLIDNIANAGFNQFQFHFSDDVGFRFAMNDMTFTDDGNSYDLSPCLGGNEAATSWYTQANVDEIITYAKSKHIEVVPSLDMPGHMNRILETFPQFKYGTSGTLDITNATAVKFACAIAEKYMRYFADKGCYRWNMGYDEIVSSSGLDTFYNNGDYHYVTDFAEKIREIAQKYNLTLRMYNEPVYYNQDVNFYVNRDIEVLYWYTDWAEYTLPPYLMRSGYKLINNSYTYYWILNNPNASVTVDKLNSTNLLTDFYNYAGAMKGYGAVLSIWCDSAGSHSSAGDGGDYIVAQTASIITAFGNAIQRAIS